ncbi:MAG: penicillin-binding protein 2, partial [Proteobacteria bacterium]|nr:penicillin-binding protein 2 [Pseudomonadota bacterium]
MYNRLNIKDLQAEIHLFHNRLITIFLVAAIVIVLLIVRLIYLQVFQQDRYTTLSTQNHLNIVPVVPTRGLIYDRNGVLLAENVPVFSLQLIPERVKNIKKTIEELGKIITLTPEDIEQFYKQKQQQRAF